MKGSNYWNLVRLDSSGRLQIQKVVRAQQYFVELFPSFDSQNISDRLIQKDLFLRRNDSNENSINADLCLRCFISHCIRQACIRLYKMFGQKHGFSLSELFRCVLDDTLDNFNVSNHQPLAVKILEDKEKKFDPNKGNLSTWTTICFKNSKELQGFLREHEVLLITNWAILNDTDINRVNKVLLEFSNLTPTEIEQASILLSSYHSVYRGDRQKNGQSRGKKCQPITTEQLERIANLVQQQANLFLSPKQTLSRLEQLADRLRQDRIHEGGGRIRQKSLDNTEINTERMQADLASSEDDVDRSDWLESYWQQFQQSLDESIEAVITNRLDNFQGRRADKASKFIRALKLFHCQGESMGAIAPQVGFKKQYQVSRLLELNDLRADIRRHMLQQMQDWTMATARLEDLDSLKQREHEIESALAEQIDPLIDQAKKKAGAANRAQSILAQRICVYLDSRAELRSG